MSWLSGVFIKAILDWIMSKISAAISIWRKDKANHETAVNQAAQDNEKATHINEGSTSDEIDDAGIDSLKHL